MKNIHKIMASVALSCVLVIELSIPAFAAVKSTKTGPLFTVNNSDTVMTANIKANQKMQIKNNIGCDLELIVDNVYQGYAVSSVNHYRISRDQSGSRLPSYGTYGDYVCFSLGRPSVTVEVGSAYGIGSQGNVNQYYERNKNVFYAINQLLMM